MNYEANGHCACANCQVESCHCGCQPGVQAVLLGYAGLACDCDPTCGCEGAEQGCVC